MLSKSFRYLSIALTAQSLISTVTGRALIARAPDCRDGTCDISDTFSEKVVPWEQVFERSAFADQLASEHKADGLERLKHARGEPIVVPDVDPDPAVAPDPSPEIPNNNPTQPKSPTNNPATNPTTPHDPDPNDNATVPKTPGNPPPDNANSGSGTDINANCKRSSSLAKRCDGGDSGDDSAEAGGFGEAPDGVADSDAAPANPTTPEPIIDFFEVARSADPPENTAVSFLHDQISGQVPDLAVRDPTSVDADYEIGTGQAEGIAVQDLDLDEIVQFTRVFDHLGIDIDPDGTRVEMKAKKGEDGKQSTYHKSLWTADGKIAFAEFSSKRVDFTPANARLKWFMTMMFIRQHILPGSPDPKGLDFICRSAIENKSTQKTMDSIYAESGIQPNSDGDLVLDGSSTDALEKAAFDAITRTDNGKGQFWLLGNFHNAFGDKVVTQIILQRSPEYGLVFVLGPAA